jgi:hypothetical protein
MIAFTHHDLLSAVELDVLTTFAAKRSAKLLTRCERFIHRASSREKAIVVSTPVEAWTPRCCRVGVKGRELAPLLALAWG